MSGKRSSYRLKTINDCSRFLAKIINQVSREEISESRASRLGYLTNILIGAIRSSDLDNRSLRNGKIRKYGLEDLEQYVELYQEEYENNAEELSHD